MALFWEGLVALLLVFSASFALIGSFGLLKLPDLMTRLHAPTKITTLGVGGGLLASMIYFGMVQGNLSLRELLITLFLFLTAPLSASFLAKAYLGKHRVQNLPQPPEGLWANDVRDNCPGLQTLDGQHESESGG